MRWHLHDGAIIEVGFQTEEIGSSVCWEQKLRIAEVVQGFALAT